MAENYYAPCREFELCNELVEKYWKAGKYEECFHGHLPLAEQGYALAECQVGYFYWEGLGVQRDMEKAFYWTERAAFHGDRDGQYNLGEFYEKGLGKVAPDLEKAKFWYRKAAAQNQAEALKKCAEYGVCL